MTEQLSKERRAELAEKRKVRLDEMELMRNGSHPTAKTSRQIVDRTLKLAQELWDLDKEYGVMVGDPERPERAR